MARRKAAAATQTTETATEQQVEGAVSATESSAPQATEEQAGLTADQLYIGKLAAQLMHPGIHNMQPEHIEARCAEALAKAEVLLATLKARYGQ